MKFQRNLLIFLSITGFGSCLSSCAAFLSIEIFFNSISFLMFALSAKTLAAMVFSYKTESILQRMNIKYAFISSQIFGIFSLFILCFGFYLKNSIFVIIGIMLTAIPSTLVSILLTISFKYTSNNDSIYRNYSGSRELITGISMFSAAILVPILLKYANIFFILKLDLLSFILGTIWLITISFGVTKGVVINKTTSLSNHSMVLKLKDTWIFILQTTSALLLIALVPIFASSNSIELTHHLPIIIKQWIWSIDAIMLILASTIYLVLKNCKHYFGYQFLLMCNGLFLILLIFSKQWYVVFLVLTTISLLATISFLQYRDDYVLKAENNTKSIAIFSSFSQLQKNLIYSISPLLVGYFFTHLNLDTIIFMIFFIQISSFITTRVLSHDKDATITKVNLTN